MRRMSGWRDTATGLVLLLEEFYLYCTVNKVGKLRLFRNGCQLLICTASPCVLRFRVFLVRLCCIRFSTIPPPSLLTLTGVESSLVSCNLRWPTTKSSANSLQSITFRTDMPYGSQVQQTQIGPCRSAMSVSYARADSTVFSAPCFQQTIHPKSSACQNIMNPSSLPCRIISLQVVYFPVITVLSESRLRITHAISRGDCSLHSEPLIADTVLAKTTFRKSCFTIKRLERPQYYHYQ